MCTTGPTFDFVDVDEVDVIFRRGMMQHPPECMHRAARPINRDHVLHLRACLFGQACRTLRPKIDGISVILDEICGIFRMLHVSRRISDC